MRDIIPFIFWPWFFTSCFILLRRRVSHGGWRAKGPVEAVAPIEFPPLPPAERLPQASVIAPSTAVSEERAAPDPVAAAVEVTSPPSAPTAMPAPGAVMTPIDPDQPQSRTVAEAVQGITMPSGLAPLMGAGLLDPREVAFFTTGHAAGDVGAALADEFERLGFHIRPIDDRTIHAERGRDLVRVRLTSAELTSSEVMHDHHASAPEDALVVELKLT